MIRIVALHAQPSDAEAYLSYYWEKHMPLVEKVPGVQKIRVGKVIGTPNGDTDPYWLVSEVFFEDAKARDLAMASEEMKVAMADVPNFAEEGQITIMYCDTQDLQVAASPTAAL